MWSSANESIGTRCVGRVERGLALGQDLRRLTEVHAGRSEQLEPAVEMLVVVPREELPAEVAGVVVGVEAVGEVGMVFEGFELAFRERVVVGDVRSAVRLVYSERGQELSDGV